MAPLRIGYIGVGMRSLGFTDFIKRHPGEFELVAVAELNLDKARVVLDHFQLEAELMEDHEALTARDDLDAVMVLTPDYAHADPAISAIRNGKHVFIEKPLATTLADCDRVIAAAEGTATVVYIGFNMRHTPVHEKIFNLIRSGELGRVTTIEANEWYNGGKTYFRRWHRLRRFGGGLWLTKACHDFDLVTWIAGGRPTSIYAVDSLSHYRHREGVGPRCRDCAEKATCPDYYDINKPYEHPLMETYRNMQLQMDQSVEWAPDICLWNSAKDTFDNGMAILTYDNDIRASYTVNVLGARTTRQMKVVGTLAMVEGDLEEGIVKYYHRHDEGRNRVYDLNAEIEGGHGGADERLMRDFLHCCRTGAAPRSGLAEGRLAVELSTAATRSADLGQVIHLNGRGPQPAGAAIQNNAAARPR